MNETSILAESGEAWNLLMIIPYLQYLLGMCSGTGRPRAGLGGRRGKANLYNFTSAVLFCWTGARSLVYGKYSV